MAGPHRCVSGGDDGFVAGLEATVFAAVLLGVLLSVVELFGLLLARDETARMAVFAVAQLADQIATQDTVEHDPFMDPYVVLVTASAEPCPVVTVTLTGTYKGVVTRRSYLVGAEASQIVTAYRDFSQLSQNDDQC